MMTDLQAPPEPRSFTEIIGLWPTAADLARDLGLSEAYERVKAWKREDFIPGHYWRDIEDAAQRRGFPVTVNLMADLAAEAKRNPKTGAA